MGVEPKIGACKHPKMDGENNGKPYEQMDDLGVFPYFWKHPYCQIAHHVFNFETLTKQ